MKLFARGAAVCLFAAALAHADTLLILPFFNGSGNPNLDWVGESIAETVREAFANQGLVALDREDRQEAFRRLGVRPYVQLTRATVVKLGQMLDADQVVYGEFDFTPLKDAAPAKGTVRITAHILNLRKMSQGPEFSEIGSLEDLAAEQRRIAWQSLQYFIPGKAPSEEEFSRIAPQVRVEAIESYTRGLLAGTYDQKFKLFSQAVRLQPDYADARYQLGLLLFGKKDYKGAAEWLSNIAATDAHARSATFFLGLSRYYLGDYAAAEAAFAEVAKAVPLNEVINNLGAAQSRRNAPEALDSFSHALEGDSADPVYHFNVGYALWKQGKFEAAADRFRSVLDRNPEDGEAKVMLGRCLKRTVFRPGDLRENAERLKTNYEESAWWQLKAVIEPKKQ